jgi:uroporphyrinogen decarboxylase
VERVASKAPVILYARGAPAAWETMTDSGVSAFSVDWQTDMPGLKARLPETVAVQGNLDPGLMLTSEKVVAREARRMLTSMQSQPGYIVNLGHGLPPDAKLGNIEALARAVVEFR